jgi:hypothetical protein
MTSITTPTTNQRDHRHAGATTEKTEWAERLGTAGWAAKGIIYLLIAFIAGQLALRGDTGGREASKQGALRQLAEQPLGKVMLIVLAVGLAAYAANRVLAIFLPATGDDGKDWLRHAGRAGSAIVYGALAAQAISVVLGSNQGTAGPSTDSSQKEWSATLLSSTPGTIVLVAIGVGFIAFAAQQVHKGATKKFLEKLDTARSHVGHQAIEVIGEVGLVARGFVAFLLGLFVLVSVWKHDPNEVKGLDGTLRTVVAAPAGQAVLLAVAFGLAAYGVFALISAECRRHDLD